MKTSNGLEKNRLPERAGATAASRASSMETAIDRGSMLAHVDVAAVNTANLRPTGEACVPKESHDAEHR